MRRVCCLLVLGLAMGCAGLPGTNNYPQPEPAVGLEVAEYVAARTSTVTTAAPTQETAELPQSFLVGRPSDTATRISFPGLPGPPGHSGHSVQPVAHQQGHASFADEATLSIDGRQYRLQLIEDTSRGAQVTLSGNRLRPAEFQSEPAPLPPLVSTTRQEITRPAAVSTSQINPIDLNLPTALSMVDGQHPLVGFAQWRVQEAYAQLDQANVLWLPSIQPGLSFHKHDGNYQASNGSIVDVHRNSFQYGLGAGATGAGTTPSPGVVARFHLADAIFQPEIAEKTAWARGHAANGVVNEQLLTVAVAYLELLNAYQDARIVEETRDRTAELSKLTADFAATGQGLQADADRLQTEATLVESRLISARERIEIASARLAQALSMSTDRPIAPLDPTVVPIDLVSLDADKSSLISTGLSNRPELKESQALVAAACEAYQRQKYSPFVPSVLLGFSTGGFGGGLENTLDNIDDRYDFDAMMLWEVRNLGFGEGAARREAIARFQQAQFDKIRVMDQVAREVGEAYSQVVHRGERIEVAKRAIESAQNSYERNLSRIREGQGLPLEVLQSVQALEEARRAYLDSVVDYNEAQFRLQWALGWPVTAPAQS